LKKAFITGITGQDGSYLAELLLDQGYEVHGLIRRASTFNTRRIDHIYHDPHNNGEIVHLYLHYGDMAVPETILDIIYNVRPDEIYHLAAQSHVKVSFEMPEYTGDVTGLGAIRILEAIRKSGLKARFYQASSSEMFGSARPPQSESTPFEPRSPYAAAKVYAYWVTRNYREGYKIFASNGILFNMRVPGVVRPSSLARSRAPWLPYWPANRTTCILATWMPGATGVMPRNTLRLCI